MNTNIGINSDEISGDTPDNCSTDRLRISEVNVTPKLH